MPGKWHKIEGCLLWKNISLATTSKKMLSIYKVICRSSLDLELYKITGREVGTPRGLLKHLPHDNGYTLQLYKRHTIQREGLVQVDLSLPI